MVLTFLGRLSLTRQCGMVVFLVKWAFNIHSWFGLLVYTKTRKVDKLSWSNHAPPCWSAKLSQRKPQIGWWCFSRTTKYLGQLWEPLGMFTEVWPTGGGQIPCSPWTTLCWSSSLPSTQRSMLWKTIEPWDLAKTDVRLAISTGIPERRDLTRKDGDAQWTWIYSKTREFEFIGNNHQFPRFEYIWSILKYKL